VGTGPARNAAELPPSAYPRHPVAAPRSVGKQMPINALPNLASYMQTHRLGEMVTHPPALINMSFCGGLNSRASQPQPLAQSFRIARTLTVSRPKRTAARGAVALQRTPQPKHRLPLSLQPTAHVLVGDI
jgi:hypothetical protein